MKHELVDNQNDKLTKVSQHFPANLINTATSTRTHFEKTQACGGHTLVAQKIGKLFVQCHNPYPMTYDSPIF